IEADHEVSVDADDSAQGGRRPPCETPLYALAMLVWLNGKFVERDAAMVSLFDAGFQHGVGLFETMLARNGSVCRVEQHMQRLADSARELLLSERLRIEPLGD